MSSAVNFVSLLKSTEEAFSSVAASHCSIEDGSRYVRSVPSYTDTTILTSISVVLVSPAPTIVITASLPQVTVTTAFAALTPKSPLLEDILRGYQSEYILAHYQTATSASSTASHLLSASSLASHPSVPQFAVSPIYTSPNQFQERPSPNHHFLNSQGEASQYPEDILCSRIITRISRTTLTASMNSINTTGGKPSMQSTTVTKTVYPANFVKKPAATKTTTITVYISAQLQTAKSGDDEQ